MTTAHAEEFVRNLKEVHQRRKELWWKLNGDLLYSRAFQAISRDRGPSVAVLIHCLAKQSVPPSQAERKRRRKAGIPFTDAPQSFSFPVREAECIGLPVKALWKALERLHETGFIDRLHAGSATKKGDFAQYRMSERWKKHGEKHFERIPWPKSENIRPNIDDRREDGTFLPRNSRKRLAEKLVVAANATTKAVLMAADATTDHVLVAADAINSDRNGPELVAADATVLHNHISKHSIEAWNQGEESGEKYNRAPSRGNGKPWRPPKSEMTENVVEILRQSPDPRATDRRFVSSLVEQLQGVQRGRLDPDRVHRDLQARHGLDTWDADLLFAIAVIDLPNCGEVVH